MRPPRLRGFPYVGRHGYSLTLRTFEACDHFTNTELVSDLRAEFLRAATEFKFAIHAYCFMPDHLHLLVEGMAPNSDVRPFVATAKQGGAFAARRCVRGRLWQSGYYDRVLRRGEELATVARYILLNRVRTGLATSISDEPYVGSQTMTLDEMLRVVGKAAV